MPFVACRRFCRRLSSHVVAVVAVPSNADVFSVHDRVWMRFAAGSILDTTPVRDPSLPPIGVLNDAHLDAILRDAPRRLSLTGHSASTTAGHSASTTAGHGGVASKENVITFFKNMALNRSVVPSIHDNGTRTYKVRRVVFNRGSGRVAALLFRRLGKAWRSAHLELQCAQRRDVLLGVFVRVEVCAQRWTCMFVLVGWCSVAGIVTR